MQLTDQEMKERLQGAVNRRLSGMQENPWLAQQVLHQKEEIAVKRHRVKFVPILVALMLLATLTVAVAEVLGINLFAEGHMPYLDPRLEPLAEDAVLETVDRVTFTQEPYEQPIEAAITNAYAEGNMLIFSYSIDCGMHSELISPEELPEKMTNLKDTGVNVFTQMCGSLHENLWESRVEAGEPIALKVWKVETGEVLDENGNPPDEVEGGVGTYGRPYGVGDYMETGIKTVRSAAEAAQGGEISISLTLKNMLYYLYFDGQDFFIHEECLNDRVAAIWAHVPINPVETHTYRGEGSLAGEPLTIEASFTRLKTTLRISYAGDAIEERPYGCTYWAFLKDENGGWVDTSVHPMDGKAYTAEANAFGDFPEWVDVYLLPVRLSSLDELIQERLAWNPNIAQEELQAFTDAHEDVIDYNDIVNAWLEGYTPTLRIYLQGEAF